MKIILIYALLLLLPVGWAFAQTEEDLLEELETVDNTEKAAIYNELARVNLSRNLSIADDYAIKAGLLATELNQKDQLALSFKFRGIVAYYNVEIDRAFSLYEESLKLFEETGNQLEVSNIYNNMALLYIYKQDFETSLTMHQKALEIRERLNNTNMVIASLTNIGNIYADMGETERAHENYLRAHELQILVFPDQINPDLLINLGRSFSDMGEPKQALLYYEQALEGATSQNNVRSMLSINITMGNYFLNQRNHEKALEHYSAAVEISQQSGSKSHEASLYLNLGNTFDATGQFERSLEYYRRAYALFSELEDQRGMHTGLNNLGIAFSRISEPDSSIYYFYKAVELSEKMNNNSLRARSYNALGNAYQENGDYQTALEYLQKGFEITVELDSVREMAQSNFFLATAYANVEELNKAETHANDALELYLKEENLDQVLKVYILLSEIHENKQQFAKALDYYKRYSTLNDSLNVANRVEQITVMQEQLNLALKERELENKNLEIAQQQLLVNQTRERFLYFGIMAGLIIFILIGWFSWYRLKQSREKLIRDQKYLETEHRLFRSQMNPHFLFNALNSIQLFISEKDSKQAERYLSKFAHLMRYYLDSSFTNFALLKDEMEGLRLNIELEHLRLNKNFDFDVKVSDDIEPDETEVPPMLAQPFIENAIKHGLRTKGKDGKLFVEFSTVKDGVMRCSVMDNGIGREAASRVKKATNGHTSRGIDITVSRLKNIWKSDYSDDFLTITDLNSETGEPDGTRVDIIFPYRF